MVYYNGNIVMYGGSSNKGLDDHNFYQFNIESKKWSILAIAGVNPGCRYQHSMNFFKPHTLFIFGGKLRKTDESNYEIVNDLYYIDLKDKTISTPFIAGVAPNPRFGHMSCCNTNFFPEEFSILGGLDKTYCALDFYTIKEIEITSNKKWTMETVKMFSNLNEQKDEIYETAKKTIINFKKQLEILDAKYLDVNKK